MEESNISKNSYEILEESDSPLIKAKKKKYSVGTSESQEKPYTTPKSIGLKRNFHKTVLQLENQYRKSKNIEIVNKLFQLYKVSIESLIII